jgi:hypothetical protein
MPNCLANEELAKLQPGDILYYVPWRYYPTGVGLERARLPKNHTPDSILRPYGPSACNAILLVHSWNHSKQRFNRNTCRLCVGSACVARSAAVACLFGLARNAADIEHILARLAELRNADEAIHILLHSLLSPHDVKE